MFSCKRWIALFVFIIWLTVLAPDLSRAAVDASSVAGIATYEGPDRDQRLMSMARKEGSVLFYTSLTASDLDSISKGFEKKYGIKVNTWRGAASDVVQRILTEASANRFDYDAVHVASLELEALRREKMLQAAKSPHLKDLIAAVYTEHREWAATWLNMYVQAYNTGKVKKEELPKNYGDLLDRKWNGRLAVESTSHEWFYALVREMGEEKGLKFFRDLVAINRPSLRIGHTALNNMVGAGEVPFALNVYHFGPEMAKRAGAPIDWLTLSPTIAMSFGVAVSRKAPHPAAAMLLYDYMITDGQKLIIERSRIPANRKYDSPFKNIKLKVLDPVVAVNESEKSDKLFENILNRQ